MSVKEENSTSGDITCTEKKSGMVSLGTVETISLDSILKEYGEVEYIKVDCEGCEYELLYGRDLSKVKILVLETHGGYIGGDDKVTELIDYLKTQFPNCSVRQLNEFYVFTSAHFSIEDGGTMLMDDDGIIVNL